jgi:hypothetical protein
LADEERLNRSPSNWLELGKGNRDARAGTQGLLLTHCNEKVIEAGVRELVLKVDVVD